MKKTEKRNWWVIVAVAAVVCIIFPSIGKIGFWLVGVMISGFAVNYLAERWFKREISFLVGCIIGLFTGGLGILVAFVTFLFFDDKTVKDVVDGFKDLFTPAKA